MFKPGNDNPRRFDIVENIVELHNANGSFEKGTLFVITAITGLCNDKLSLMDNYKNCIKKVDHNNVKKVYR